MLVVVHGLDLLLEKFEGREEDGVDGAGPSHGDTEAAIHVSLEELDLDRLDFLALGVHERVALVDALGGVNWV